MFQGPITVCVSGDAEHSIASGTPEPLAPVWFDLEADQRCGEPIFKYRTKVISESVAFLFDAEM
jgi:hypothetical protein